MPVRNKVYYATRTTDTYFECHISANKKDVLAYDALSFRYLIADEPHGNRFQAEVQRQAKHYNMIQVKPEAEQLAANVKAAMKSFIANPGAMNSNVLMGQLIRYQRATQLNAKPISNTEAARILANIDWIKAYTDAGVSL